MTEDEDGMGNGQQGYNIVKPISIDSPSHRP